MLRRESINYYYESIIAQMNTTYIYDHADCLVNINHKIFQRHDMINMIDDSVGVLHTSVTQRWPHQPVVREKKNEQDHRRKKKLRKLR